MATDTKKLGRIFISILNKSLFFDNLLKILRNPYLDRKGIIDYQAPPKSSVNKYQTFCGT